MLQELLLLSFQFKIEMMEVASAHAEAARLVNIVHQLHVSKTFDAVAARLFVFEDALCEMIRFGDELRRVLGRIGLVDWGLSAHLSCQVLPLVGEGRLYMEKPFRTVNSVEAAHWCPVGSVAASHNSGREAHRP